MCAVHELYDPDRKAEASRETSARALQRGCRLCDARYRIVGRLGVTLVDGILKAEGISEVWDLVLRNEEGATVTYPNRDS